MGSSASCCKKSTATGGGPSAEESKGDAPGCASLFPARLETKNGLVATSSALGGAALVGIYFSAHWCPPCRAFTPRLSEFYRKAQAEAPGALQVVFVSSDQDASSASSYYSEMADWAMVPFKGSTRNALSKRFGVRGIPTFVVVDGNTGAVITKEARSDVGEGVGAALAKWGYDASSARAQADSSSANSANAVVPPPPPANFAASMFGDSLLTKNGPMPTLGALTNKRLIGIYFSAHWCPPCRQFTPRLSEFYRQAQDAEPNELEIVFVSSDQTPAAAAEYFNEMADWLMVPHGTANCQALAQKYEVRGIPSFVVVDGRTGKLLTKTARGDVGPNVARALEKWRNL